MRNSEVEALIAFLRRIQQERYYSLRGLAQVLGFSSAHLCMVLSGKRRPGIRFIRAVAARFPAYRRLLQCQLDDPLSVESKADRAAGGHDK